LAKNQKKGEQQGWSRPPSAPEVRRRLAALRDYRWSSYPAYAGYRQPPAWLTTQELLRRIGGRDERQRRAKYRRFAEAILRQGVEPEGWGAWRERVALGSAEFCRQLGRVVRADARTQPQARQLRPRPSFGDVVRSVEKVRGEPWAQFRERYGDWGRDLVLWLARRYGGLGLVQLGQQAGGMSAAAVSEAVRRLQRSMSDDEALQRTAAMASTLLKIET
jgi:hypothetical protein